MLYDEHLAKHRAATARLLARERVASVARVAAFIAIVVVAAAGGNWFALIPAIAFIALIVMHDRMISARRRSEAASRFYERGLGRVNDDWTGKGVDGAQFADEHHPFAGDLDLFGRGSLFELMCIASTSAGRSTLASWLENPGRATGDEVRGRQEAVRELRDRLDLREDLAVVAGGIASEIESAHLAEWAAEPALVGSRIERIGAWVISILLTITTLRAVFEAFDALARQRSMSLRVVLPFVVMSIIGSTFTGRLRERVQKVIGAVERREPALALLASVIARIERERFSAPLLRALHERLMSDGVPASHAIDRLRRLVSLLDARRNQLFMPVGAMLLWTTHLSFSIDSWRRRVGAQRIGAWLGAIGEIEALLSLASFAFEHPAFTTPEIVEGDALFDATAAGHPLIPAARRITNDVALGGELRLLIVSGSNMSGKSTMLRTIGINAVLALAGANVCASRLRVAPMAIGASIRLHDSLAEGASRFYAEIVRIREIIGMQPPLLFLLDELLHGTNSHDRRVGAEAIVRGLVARGAIGLATTHDLALAAIAEELSPRARNVHFEDHIEAGRMVFDYTMRPGVVTKSNALELMRAVGIL